jgi:DNA-binding transcriptional LysR family regulator
LLLSDQRQDLVAEAVDVAVRIGVRTDSTAMVRRIGVSHRVLAASPAYLSKAGMPTAPADLAAHAVIVGPASAGSDGWAFRKEGKAASVRVSSRITVTGTEGATAAAVAG